MSSLEAEKFEEPEFRWLQKRGIGGRKKDVQFYESFNYDGENYSLYDCVYMHKESQPPYIGKLVKIWENADKSKKVKIQWFFRPSEISHYLGDAEVLENELFFAAGGGTGLANINPLEAVAGKCNVVCISTDRRNPQPSAEECQMANYVFFRTFDVDSLTISDQMSDTVGGLQVEFVFNRKESDRTIKAVACEETITLSGKNTPEQSKTLKSEETSNYEMEKEVRDVKRVQAKNESLLVETNNVSLNREAASGLKSPSGVVNSSKDEESMGNDEKISASGSKDVGCKVNGIKDKVKDMKSPVISVHVEEVMDSARKSSDIDNKPSKRVKIDDAVTSAEDKGVKGAQNLTVCGDDKMSNMTRVISSNTQPKTELFKNFVGLQKDVKEAENCSSWKENLSKISVASFKEAPKCGHAENAVVLTSDAKLSKNLETLEETLPKTSIISSREKEKSGCAKNSIGHGKDLEIAKNLSTCREISSTANIGSINESPKSHSNRKFEGRGNATNVVKDSSDSTMKRPSKISACLFKEKSSFGHDADRKKTCVGNQNDVTLTKDLYSMGERPLKIAKLNNSSRMAINNNDRSTKNSDKIGLTEAKKLQSERKTLSAFVSPKEEKLKSISRLSKNLGVLDKDPSKEHRNGNSSKLPSGNLPKSSIAISKGEDGKIDGQVFEVTRKPVAEKSTWFKELPWEQRMKSAHDEGTLVLLQNLDPEFTSGEVEDIIWHAFMENCTAKMVQHTAFSSPHSGQAFVIFKTREVAERVVKKLDDGCLMLPNKRPLVGSIAVLPKLAERLTTFIGHLTIDKARRLMQRDMKEAVSTSHYSQTNTIEYEMAMAWCLLQSKSDSWWDKLYEQQKMMLKKLTAEPKLKKT